MLAWRWVWRYAETLPFGSLARVIRRDVDGHLRTFWRADAAAVGRRSATAPIDHAARRLQVRGRMPNGADDPAVTGTDLRRVGLTPGPRFGAILADADRGWLAERLETRPAVDRWIRNIAESLPDDDLAGGA